MLKKILLAIAIAIPAISFAQSKFGTVDLQALMPLMPEYKTAQEQYVAASKTYEDESGKLIEEFNKKQQELQELSADTTTPQTILERRYTELGELQQRIEQFMQNAKEDLARQEQTLMAPIQEKLINAVKTLGAEQGYTMIFPAGLSVYTGTDVVDVTDAVKAKLGI